MGKILVVLTGGTIGSVVCGDTVGLKEGSPYRLISEYEGKYGKDTEFEVINPINILSENLEPCVWETLFNELLSRDLSGYDGMIITHGSDTLSYTAAMAGFLLRHLPFPTVITASGKPIGEEGSNGLCNFRNSVCLIRGETRGVFVVYSDKHGKNNVYIATRILEADGFSDEFSAFGGAVYGTMENEHFVKNGHKINDICFVPETPLCKRICFKNSIMMITPYPGIDYGRIDFSEKPKAVLHMMYHSSTANEKRLGEFSKRCEKEGVDLYLSPFKADSFTQYETTRKILSGNVFPLCNISREAAFAKLMLAYNIDGVNAAEFMKQSIYHEILK